MEIYPLDIAPLPPFTNGLIYFKALTTTPSISKWAIISSLYSTNYHFSINDKHRPVTCRNEERPFLSQPSSPNCTWSSGPGLHLANSSPWKCNSIKMMTWCVEALVWAEERPHWYPARWILKLKLLLMKISTLLITSCYLNWVTLLSSSIHLLKSSTRNGVVWKALFLRSKGTKRVDLLFNPVKSKEWLEYSRKLNHNTLVVRYGAHLCYFKEGQREQHKSCFVLQHCVPDVLNLFFLYNEPKNFIHWTVSLICMVRHPNYIILYHCLRLEFRHSKSIYNFFPS